MQKFLVGRGGVRVHGIYTYMLTLRLQSWSGGWQFSFPKRCYLRVDVGGVVAGSGFFEILCHRDEELECWI